MQVPSQQLLVDETSRYRNAIYPAKLWATYAAPGLEITAGDSYVQFGRGLVLSMRKIDELGVDTTLRGGKIEWQGDPFAATFVAGVANPSRVDEATGRALFLPLPPPIQGSLGAQPLFGSDRIVGAEIQAGRGLPVVLTTHAVRVTRSAPYPNEPQGHIGEGGVFDAPLGSCAPSDTAQWLEHRREASTNPTIDASQILHGRSGLRGAEHRRTRQALHGRGRPEPASTTVTPTIRWPRSTRSTARPPPTSAP